MKIKIKANQKSIINFLIADICITAIKFFIVQSIPGLYQYNDIANILISGILIIFLIPAFLAVLKEKPKFVIISLVILFFLLGTQLLIFPQNTEAIVSNIPKIVGMSYGCLIAGGGLREFDTFYDRLIFFTKLNIIFGGVQFIATEFLGIRGVEILDYNMSFGFFLVVPVLVQFNSFLKNEKKNVVDIIFALAGFVMVLILGSRGAILAIVLGGFLCYVNNIDLAKIRDIVSAFSAIVMTLLILINFKSIAMSIYVFLSKRNLNSRLITMLLFGDITSTTNRDVLQENVSKLIMQHPLIGNGMLSDLSSHNIFLETFLFFGIPMGMILVLIIVCEWIKPIFEPNKVKRSLLIIFGAYAIVDALFNLTVLGKDIFWIYMGLAMTTKITFGRKVRQ